MNMEFHQPWWASAILITWERIWKSCCSSVAKLCLTLCDPMDCSTPGSPVLQSLPEFAHIELVMLSNQLNPFSFCLQTFPASGSFPVSQLFISEGQSIGASASVLPMNNQGWFPLGLTDFISLWAKRLSRVFSNTTVQRHQFFDAQPSLWSFFMIASVLTSVLDY